MRESTQCDARMRRNMDMLMKLKMSDYRDIVMVEAEISGYRRGCIRVSIDLEKELVIWRDSRQWNNNFLRSISSEKIGHFREALPFTKLLQWTSQLPGQPCEDGAPPAHAVDWAVSVAFREDGRFRIAGRGSFPEKWCLLRDLIEAVTKTPFRLR